MESIQQQISTLTRKVDRVYQIIDRLHQHVFQNLDTQTIGGEETSIEHPVHRHPQLTTSDARRRIEQEIASYRTNGYVDLPSSANDRQETANWAIDRQGMSIDNSGLEIGHHQVKEQHLSPEFQIQRLTAQLTAAYNRIAALEEQLLAKRWK
jgi:hypothetical protein